MSVVLDDVKPWSWDRPVLGVETSCDETAAAVVANGRILSNVVFSQTEHSLYGGVVRRPLPSGTLLGAHCATLSPAMPS